MWGIAANAGGTAEAGVGAAAAGTANSGVGVFGGGNSGVNVGGYTASGGYSGVDNGKQWVAGATAGFGAGGFITNAKCAKQLKGPFDTWTLNLPIISLQFASGGGIWTAGASAGKSWGLSLSRYNVTTTTASGCACQ